MYHYTSPWVEFPSLKLSQDYQSQILSTKLMWNHFWSLFFFQLYTFTSVGHQNEGWFWCLTCVFPVFVKVKNLIFSEFLLGKSYCFFINLFFFLCFSTFCFRFSKHFCMENTICLSTFRFFELKRVRYFFQRFCSEKTEGHFLFRLFFSKGTINGKNFNLCQIWMFDNLRTHLNMEI